MWKLISHWVKVFQHCHISIYLSLCWKLKAHNWPFEFVNLCKVFSGDSVSKARLVLLRMPIRPLLYGQGILVTVRILTQQQEIHGSSFMHEPCKRFWMDKRPFCAFKICNKLLLIWVSKNVTESAAARVAAARVAGLERTLVGVFWKSMQEIAI